MAEPTESLLAMDSWSVSPAVDGADSQLRFLGSGALGGGTDVGIGLNLPKGDPRRGDRHQEQCNVVYCDGHVKPIRSSALITLVPPTATYSKFTNYTVDAGAWVP